ncbi:MAG: hypothetical protein U0694_29435 [Anaerolineae bacterium]
MSENNNQVLYELYEVINVTSIHTETNQFLGNLEVGEKLYARADTLKTTETRDHELMSIDTKTEIQHERGWSMVKFVTNDRDFGYDSTEYLKLVGQTYGSADQYPSAGTR